MEHSRNGVCIINRRGRFEVRLEEMASVIAYFDGFGSCIKVTLIKE